jgi:hypothetical protein
LWLSCLFLSAGQLTALQVAAAYFHETVEPPAQGPTVLVLKKSSSISGLVVEYIVAIDVTRARFPADAFLLS